MPCDPHPEIRLRKNWLAFVLLVAVMAVVAIPCLGQGPPPAASTAGGTRVLKTSGQVAIPHWSRSRGHRFYFLARWLPESPDNGVLRSDDGGRAWMKVLFVSNDAQINGISSSPVSNMVVAIALRSNGPQNAHTTVPFLSVDSGQTWRLLRSQWERYRFGAVVPTEIGADNAIYVGSNVLLESQDDGVNWFVMSPDLTRADFSRANPGTIASIAIPDTDTPDKVIYVGTDDGLVQVSPDGGRTWHNITPRTPYEWAAASVAAAIDDPAEAFVAFDSKDVSAARLFRTRDYGKTWAPIGDGLPTSVKFHMLRSWPARKQFLALATDTGVFFSEDDGDSWKPLLGSPRFAFALGFVGDSELLVAANEGDASTVTTFSLVVQSSSIPPAVATGGLRVSSHPGGVQVYLDDVFKGITSEAEGWLVVEGVPTGTHRLRLSLPGRQDATQQVMIGGGVTKAVDLTLAEATRGPLDVAEVEGLLKNGVAKKRVTSIVKQYGVNFTMTPEIEKRLRDDGADGDLLYAITQNQK